MFVDKVEVQVKAGNGGDGLISFRHEKYVDKGGPDGGDGGDGGDIIFVGDTNVNTLSPFRYNKIIRAENGKPGRRRKQHGRTGPAKKIIVPLGTIVFENGQQIADITEKYQNTVIANGGKGGYGNAHFTSSRRQTPRVAEKGEQGEEKKLVLELKMLADVGIVGLPNAGKSTLLSTISNARPEIADYPFTTLSPKLGVVDTDNTSLLFADIPGLIEGASKGKGLGDEFLKHIERTQVLVHLIDASTDSPAKIYKTLNHELASYTIDLSNKPQVVALTKIDAVTDEVLKKAKKALKRSCKGKIFPISSIARKGLKPLLREINKQVLNARRKAAKTQARTSRTTAHHTLEDLSDAWRVEKIKKGFVVSGEKIERFAGKTDFTNSQGVERLEDIMRKTGITHELERKGIIAGNVIYIGSVNKPIGTITHR